MNGWPRRALTFGVAVLLLAACSGSGGGRTSPPTPIRWIAAGDSYGAGVGATGSRGRCGATDHATAPLARAKLEGQVPIDAFEFVACSGAKVDDVLDQIRSAKANGGKPFNLVTVTIGGNDVGFAKVLADCLGADDLFTRKTQDTPPGCDVTEHELARRVEAVSTRLVSLYNSIRKELAPNAALVVIGYPQLFADPAEWPEDSCGGMSKADARMLRAADLAMDTHIADAAKQAGATYVSLLQAFEHHELCGPSDRWMNGLTLGLQTGSFHPTSSFHPNDDGERAEADVVVNVLRKLYVVG